MQHNVGGPPIPFNSNNDSPSPALVMSRKRSAGSAVCLLLQQSQRQPETVGDGQRLISSSAERKMIDDYRHRLMRR